MKKIFVFLGLMLIFSCTKKEFIIENIPFQFGENNAEPNLVAKDGNLTLSWISSVRDKEATLYYSQLTEGEWDEPKTITSGSDWFVNWADFPANAINNNLLLTSYLKKSATGTYTYDVVLTLQTLFGKKIRKDFLLNTDGVEAEHGFVSMVPNNKDGFFITWLDGRNTVKKTKEAHHKAMTIRFAEISSTGEIINESELDSSTCDCCQTSITMTVDGPVIVYRDRSKKEIRDIYIARNVDGVWLEPKAVYNDKWKINGCPVNGPKVVSNTTNIAVAWFTVVEESPLVNLAFSTSNGESFNAPIKINDNDALGRVDVVFLNKENVLVSYMETSDVGTYLRAKKVSINGKISEAITIAKINAGRSTGVPQLEIIENQAFVVWTISVDGKNQLKSVKFDIEAI